MAFVCGECNYLRILSIDKTFHINNGIAYCCNRYYKEKKVARYLPDNKICFHCFEDGKNCKMIRCEKCKLENFVCDDCFDSYKCINCSMFFANLKNKKLNVQCGKCGIRNFDHSVVEKIFCLRCESYLCSICYDSRHLDCKKGEKRKFDSKRCSTCQIQRNSYENFYFNKINHELFCGNCKDIFLRNNYHKLFFMKNLSQFQSFEEKCTNCKNNYFSFSYCKFCFIKTECCFGCSKKTPCTSCKKMQTDPEFFTCQACDKKVDIMENNCGIGKCHKSDKILCYECIGNFTYMISPKQNM